MGVVKEKYIIIFFLKNQQKQTWMTNSLIYDLTTCYKICLFVKRVKERKVE